VRPKLWGPLLRLHGHAWMRCTPTAAVPAGLVFVRRGAGGAAAVAAWAAAVVADPGTPDHVHFAALARRGGPAPRRAALGRLSGAPGAGRAAGLRAHPVDPRLVLGFGGAAAVGVLPLASFGNGHTFFVQRLHEVRARSR